MKILKKLLSNPLSVVGIVILLGYSFVAIFAPVLAPPEDSDQPYMVPNYGWTAQPKPPSGEHLFGTTESQYSIFYGVVWGTRTAFIMGFGVVLLSSMIGLLFGSISGYVGGALDEVMQRILEVFMSIPFLIGAMVIVTVLGRSLFNVMLALIIFGWMSYARLIRGNVLSVKETEYVEASEAVGSSHLRIILRHILPNSIYPMVIQASMNIGAMVITASSLSFLGVGTPAGFADWGQMVSFSRNWILGTQGNPFEYWYTVFIPGMAVIFFSLSWNLIGDAFRDIMDPRMQGSI